MAIEGTSCFPFETARLYSPAKTLIGIDRSYHSVKCTFRCFVPIRRGINDTERAEDKTIFNYCEIELAFCMSGFLIGANMHQVCGSGVIGMLVSVWSYSGK